MMVAQASSSTPKLELRHKRKKKKHRGADSNAAASPFHPPIMFCGDCASCAAPPPPISMAAFAIDEESPSVDTTLQQNARSMQLRVYNAKSATANHTVSERQEGDADEDAAAGRMGILKTILADLEGVNDVTVSKSHLPPRTEYGDFATVSDAELVDPTSCMVTVNYSTSTNNSNVGSSESAITDNPQEAKQKDGSKDSIRRAVLNRLSEAGYDYAEVSADNAPVSRSIPEPPISCRTRLRVQGICCSSEVPAVRAILKPLPGVRKIGVNVATKVVFIDHDPGIISAASMAGALNDEKFGAELVTDGVSELKREASSDALHSANDGSGRTSSLLKNMKELPRSDFVESTIFIPSLINYSRREQIESCPIGKLLRQNFFSDHLRAYHLHAPSRTLKVEHNPELLSSERIMEVLHRGLTESDWGKIELAHDGAVEGLRLPFLSSDSQVKGGSFEEEQRKHCHGLKINVIVSGIFWILSLLSLEGGSLSILKYAGLFAVLFGLPPVLVKAWKTLRRCQFDANCMMVTAALGALALGEFDEAASVSFLFAVSEWLETRATGKARRALGEIVSLRPDYANVVHPTTGDLVVVPASNIPVGSVVSVRTGDKVPADGTVIEGTSSVDESSLTGEARPVEKKAGDDVSGGSINVGSTQLVVKTTSTVGDSTVSRLIQLVEEAQANTSETEQLVDAFARRYTPIVISFAFLICTVPWFFGPEIGRHWMMHGLVITVIACPCALTISTPVTYSAGLAATAQRGIIVKGGSKLEALGNVKTVLLDKTGTITTGRFSLSHLDIIGDLKSRKEVLELLAIMEAPSSHPLSACLVLAAKDEGVMVPPNISLTEHTILKGEGVTAYVDGRRIYVGNERLFKRLGMYDISEEHKDSSREWASEGATVGYLGIEGSGIISMFSVKDTIREEAQEVVASLRQSGVEVIMLTGDGDGAAQAVGSLIGLDKSSIRSQLLPEDKLHYVSGLKETSAGRHPSLSGKKTMVLMVGDGVNDAPALSISDVGVAMGEGASLAMEMSDVTLMDSNLSKLLFSMNMGAKVIRTVRENIAFSVLVNAIAIMLTFMERMTLLWAIVSDVGVMLIVTLNGMKLLSSRTIEAIEGKSMEKHATKKRGGHRYVLSPRSATGEVELV